MHDTDIFGNRPVFGSPGSLVAQMSPKNAPVSTIMDINRLGLRGLKDSRTTINNILWSDESKMKLS